MIINDNRTDTAGSAGVETSKGQAERGDELGEEWSVMRSEAAEMDRPPIESRSFDVGHEGLDKEHRRLVVLINDLCASVTTQDAKVAARRLRALTVEANRHTDHETLVLRSLCRAIEERNSVPQRLKTAMAAAIEDHIGDHLTLRTRLAEIKQTVQSGGWTEGTSLCQVVEMWFLEHAVRHDTQIKAIIRSVQPDP